MNKLETIKQACIKANPSIIVNPHAQLIGFDHKVTYFEECRPIRLADVLVAIHSTLEGSRKKLDVNSAGLFTGNFFDWEYDQVYFWNLKKDSLTDQSEETIEFLYQLLK